MRPLGMLIAMVGSVGVALAVWHTDMTAAQFFGLLAGLVAVMAGCWLMGAGTAMEANR